MRGEKKNKDKMWLGGGKKGNYREAKGGHNREAKGQNVQGEGQKKEKP